MDDATPEPAHDPKRPPHDPDAPAPKAPRFGCVLFALVFAFFTGALVFALMQGSRMAKDIEAFTAESPVELPAERGTPEELAAIREKIAVFLEAVTPTVPPPTELALSRRELNLLIANHNYLTDIRGRFYIDTIENVDGEAIISTRASRPRPKILFWKPRRYLNADIDVRVEAAEGQFFLRVADVRVEGATINSAILEYMKTEDLLDMYKNDEDFKTVTKKISSARIEGDTLIVSTETDDDAGEAAKTSPSGEESP